MNVGVELQGGLLFAEDVERVRTKRFADQRKLDGRARPQVPGLKRLLPVLDGPCERRGVTIDTDAAVSATRR